MSEKEPKVVRLEHPGQGFWEQVEVDGEYQYACYQPPRDYQTEPKEIIDYQTYRVEPSDDDSVIIHYIPLKRCPWPLPGEPVKPRPDLWTQIHGFIYKHVDLPDDRLYDVLAAWVQATWVLEAWTVIPYLQLLGPKISGKTRLLEVLQALCYRGMLAANISEAALFRSVEKFHPTLLLDEAEIYGFKERSVIQNLLNTGYRRGQFAIRVRSVENDIPRLDMFDTFGFKVLAGTGEFKDTLESRAIRINMEKNIRPVSFSIDTETAREIRSQMLLWRWRRLSEISEVSEGHREEAPEGLEFCDGRFAELYSPLVLVANHGRKTILSYARESYGDRMDEEETSVDAQVVSAILKSYPYLESGKFSTSLVTEAFNEDRNDNEKWKSRSIGRVIKRLGLKAKRMTGGASGWLWDNNRIKRLATRYNLTPQTTSLTSLSSLEDKEPICEDCGQPITDGSNILWKGQDRICSRCSMFRKKMRENDL